MEFKKGCKPYKGLYDGCLQKEEEKAMAQTEKKIRLHDIKGNTIMVNPNQIFSYGKDHRGYTLVTLKSGDVLHVREDKSYIKQIISFG